MSLDLLEIAVVTLFICGLAAVVWEILSKNPRSLIEITTDSRRFAERPVFEAEVRPIGNLKTAPAANLNRDSLAA